MKEASLPSAAWDSQTSFITQALSMSESFLNPAAPIDLEMLPCAAWPHLGVVWDAIIAKWQ